MKRYDVLYSTLIPVLASTACVLASTACKEEEIFSTTVSLLPFSGKDADVPCDAEPITCKEPCRYYVSPYGKKESGDGMSWAASKLTLQEGINAAYCAVKGCDAVKTCEVWVGEGHYFVNTMSDNATHETLRLRSGVSVYGGFWAGATVFEDRDLTDDNSLGSWLFPSETGDEMVDTLITAADGARFDGFHIQAGYKTGTVDDTDSEKPMKRDSVRTAISVSGGTFTLANSNIFIVGPDGDRKGTAVRVVGGNLTVDNCLFRDIQGSAIDAVDSTLNISDTLFRDNETIQTESVVSTAGETQLVISDTRFYSNTASEGVLHLKELSSGSTMVAENVVFMNNSAETDGAIVSCDPLPKDAWVEINNSTIYMNKHADESGDTVRFALPADADYTGMISIANTIVWRNEGNGLTFLDPDENVLQPDVVQYSIIQGGYEGSGNMDADPMITEPSDYYDGYPSLAADSPCIDAANGDAAPETDILGKARWDAPDVDDTGIGDPSWADIGAVEFQEN